MLKTRPTKAHRKQGRQARTTVLVVIIIYIADPVSAARTSCSVTRLDTGSLSVECTYPVNLRENRQSISLMHFGSNGDPFDVAYSCAWEDNKAICITERGFFYPQNITNQITFEVQNPYNKAEFACDTIPPDKTLFVERCSLEKTGNDTAPTTTAPKEPPTTPTCRPTSTDEKVCPPDSSCSSYTAAVVVLVILLVVSLAINVWLFWKLKHRRFSCWGSPGAGRAVQPPRYESPMIQETAA